MKRVHTKSHRLRAYKLETTGNLERKLLVVVQKLSIVVTAIITRAGTAFTSSQKLIKELVTRTMPGRKTVVK